MKKLFSFLLALVLMLSSVSALAAYNDHTDYVDWPIVKDGEKLTVSDICDAFSISRSALQSLFHEQLDCGVIDHFNKMKIQRAKDIICDGSMNLTEIAYFLSYSSLPYFSKQFRIATGMSPSAYASSVKGITDALRNSKERERDA